MIADPRVPPSSTESTTPLSRLKARLTPAEVKAVVLAEEKIARELAVTLAENDRRYKIRQAEKAADEAAAKLKKDAESEEFAKASREALAWEEELLRLEAVAYDLPLEIMREKRSQAIVIGRRKPDVESDREEGF